MIIFCTDYSGKNAIVSFTRSTVLTDWFGVSLAFAACAALVSVTHIHIYIYMFLLFPTF